jgi:predicted nucleic acid-binding protein
VGILVDSTVFIEAERKGLSARRALAEIALHFPSEEAAISVITLTELVRHHSDRAGARSSSGRDSLSKGGSLSFHSRAYGRGPGVAGYGFGGTEGRRN